MTPRTLPGSGNPEYLEKKFRKAGLPVPEAIQQAASQARNARRDKRSWIERAIASMPSHPLDKRWQTPIPAPSIRSQG